MKLNYEFSCLDHAYRVSANAEFTSSTPTP